MKQDLVNRWTRSEAKKGNTKVQCAKRLNDSCDKVIRFQEIYTMEQGGRRPDRCARFIMLNDTMEGTLREFGYTREKPMTSKRWSEFINSLLETKA